MVRRFLFCEIVRGLDKYRLRGPPSSEMSADTHHAHIRRGQDQSENDPTRLQNVRPDGEYSTIRMKSSTLHPYHVLLALGRCILRPFRATFRFISASVNMVMVRVCTPFQFSPRHHVWLMSGFSFKNSSRYSKFVFGRPLGGPPPPLASAYLRRGSDCIGDTSWRHKSLQWGHESYRGKSRGQFFTSLSQDRTTSWNNYSFY